MSDSTQHMAAGAEPTAAGVTFRIWAPRARAVEVVFDESALPPLQLALEANGFFAALCADAHAGSLYRYAVDGRGPYPDPYSRFQPKGPHGPSMVVDPRAYRWHDADWPGIRIKGQVIYELHIGTFTREGTYAAAASELPELAALGVTCIELMPVAEFPGRFNWGYDGVDLFAPYHGYGDPEALRAFVDAAHAAKLGVILDVVYNHFGPDGNYLPCFAPDYFTERYKCEWGEAINFDGPACGPVRQFFIDNAAYWVREFHLDGLRLDATQSIHDSTRPHVLSQIVQCARAAAAPRDIIIIAENEPQHAELLWTPEEGGVGLDAMWNDDFHHSSRVALTGSHDGYFHDYRGRAQEFVSALKYGFLFQGQHYCWQQKPRGTAALDRPAWAFIAFTQNHDQVANTFYGLRLQQLTSPGRLRAMTALLLLGPHTPMLFMGQEFAASSPFAFFSDNEPQAAQKARIGRKEFVAQFSHYATPAAQERLLDPTCPQTFESCKLNFAERVTHAFSYDMHRHLLRLRREDPVLGQQHSRALDGAVLAERAFLLRWFDAVHGDRLVLVNLAHELELGPAPEPLLAPPRGARWEMLWSSDEPHYGGPGAVDPSAAHCWRVPAESAVLFRSVQSSAAPPHAGGQ